MAPTFSEVLRAEGEIWPGGSPPAYPRCRENGFGSVGNEVVPPPVGGTPSASHDEVRLAETRSRMIRRADGLVLGTAGRPGRAPRNPRTGPCFTSPRGGWRLAKRQKEGSQPGLALVAQGRPAEYVSCPRGPSGDRYRLANLETATLVP